MTREEAVSKLEKIGFVKDKNYFVPGNTISLFKRIQGSDCQCNKRPPLIEIDITKYKEHLSIEIGIKGQAVNMQWIHFMFYAMPIEEIDNVETYEYLLAKSWEGVN